MLRMCLLATAICTVLSIPAFASDAPGLVAARPQRPEVVAAAAGIRSHPEACPADWMPEEFNSDAWWRFQAWHNLDCLTRIVDEVLNTRENREESTATLSREELERLRALALKAKDAAARIGR
jgi:hypothetical protein